MRLQHGTIVKVLFHRDRGVQAVVSVQLLQTAGKRYLAGFSGDPGEFENPAPGGADAHEANHLEPWLPDGKV